VRDQFNQRFKLIVEGYDAKTPAGLGEYTTMGG